MLSDSGLAIPPQEFLARGPQGLQCLACTRGGSTSRCWRPDFLSILAAFAGGEPIRPAADAGRFALAAIGAGFAAASCLPGWVVLDVWRFASAVTGGRLLTANITSPWLIVGRRGFMPPVPPLPA